MIFAFAAFIAGVVAGLVLGDRHVANRLEVDLANARNRSQFIPYPANWPPRVNGTGSPCDMLRGPCCCGGWHQLEEWVWNVESIAKSEMTK